MRVAAKLFKSLASAAAFCMGAGVFVSKVEKKKGWVEGHKPGFYEKELKRPFDFGLSLLALLFFWPVMLILAFAVRLEFGKPVLFRQERPGLGGEVFVLCKYRTMLERRGEDGALLPDGRRLTRFGKKLRASSLDELPELFNILRGDMSIIGPRPLLVGYLPKYNGRQRHRHDVRPGLTGLAQVSGRNELGWAERFEADVAYVRNITFLGDLGILAKTVAAVIRKKGISSKASETMEAFTGNGK